MPRVAVADSTESLADPPYVDIRLPFGGDAAEKKKALKAEAKELCMMLEKLFSIRTHAATAGFDCHTYRPKLRSMRVGGGLG